MAYRSRRVRTHAAFACLLLPALALPAHAASAPVTGSVHAIRIEGNHLLPDATLSTLTASLVKRPFDLDALNAAAARIQNAYREAGYGGVIAYVPPQESSDGTVVIKVLEGKLAKVNVTGNTHFTLQNVRAGLPHIREGSTPLVRAIDQDIQLSNDNPAKHVNVMLTAGALPGDIDANVSVTDRPPVQYLVGFNNTGTSATGRHRLSVGVEHANLFGLDHVGTLQFQTSPEYPGRVRIFSGGYRVPLYGQTASLDAFAAYSTVSNGTTATTAGPLSFTGRGTILGLRGNLHLDRIGEYDHSVTLGVDHRRYKDDCSIGEFGAAGCGSAAADVSTTPVSLAYTGQKSAPTLSYGFNTSLAINVAGSSAETFEAARSGAKRRYVIARVAGFAEKPISPNLTLLGRLEMQYAPDRLISAERFGAGGSNSVRGYSERELSGDMGMLLRLEASSARIDWIAALPARALVLLDYGRVSNHAGLPCRGLSATSCSITGAGVGLRLSMARYATATIDVARAMQAGTTTSRGDIRAHLALNLTF